MKNNIAKIADVGFTKEKALLTGSIIGTPTNMAPEVLQGMLYDAKADIYSLSIMLWEMWYAVKVFSEDYNKEVIRNYPSLRDHVIGHHRPDFTARYAPMKLLQSLIESCWNADPKERPTAKSIVQTLKLIDFER